MRLKSCPSEPGMDNEKTASQMDIAPWCYKWDGWDWMSPGRGNYGASYGAIEKL